MGVVAEQGQAGDPPGPGLDVEGGDDTGLGGDVEGRAVGSSASTSGLSPTVKRPAGRRSGQLASMHVSTGPAERERI
jgi:hypothetical protein